MSRPPAQSVAAEDVVVAVETYADRLHDLLRRRGLGTADATGVVNRSADELVEVAASDAPADPLGWWWARALSMGEKTRSAGRPQTRDDDPVDSALLQLAAPLQLAVLLRDDYDLPLESVAGALGVGRSLTAARILQGRLELVAAHDGTELLDLTGHVGKEPLDPVGLLGVADGALAPGDNARMRRHLRSCAACEAVVTAAQRGRRLAAALPVEALADDPREELVARIRNRAHALLPALSDLMAAQDEEAAEESSRPLVPLPVVLVSLAVALVLGALTGAVTAPSKDHPAAQAGSTPSAAPSLTTAPSASASASATPSATPRPRTSATASSRPTATPSRTQSVVAGPARISINPTSGPNNQSVTVTGTGWDPGTSVSVDYVNLLGQTTSSSFAQVDARGRFVTTLVCSDPVPGQHTIRASDGVHSASQTYTEQ